MKRRYRKPWVMVSVCCGCGTFLGYVHNVKVRLAGMLSHGLCRVCAKNLYGLEE